MQEKTEPQKDKRELFLRVASAISLLIFLHLCFRPYSIPLDAIEPGYYREYIQLHSISYIAPLIFTASFDFVVKTVGRNHIKITSAIVIVLSFVGSLVAIQDTTTQEDAIQKVNEQVKHQRLAERWGKI